MLFSNELISNDAAEVDYKERIKAHTNIKTIKKEELNQFLYDNPKFEVIKENLKSFSVGVSKEKSVIFENKVWCLFYKMGFKKFNSLKKLEIPYDEGVGCKKQIDVFCCDDETALIIECKSGYSSSSLKENVESYVGIIKGLRNSIKKELGKTLNIAFIYATENYNFTDVDENRFNNISGPHYHFDEKMIDNYYQLVNQIGAAAKYQLLGLLFKDVKIKNFDNRVPAIEGKMGGITYYSFVMKPSQLLKIAYVLHRNNINSTDEMMPSYQRIIKKDRLVKIREFINNNGYFPNSIIVSIRTDNINDKKLNFEPAPCQSAEALNRIGNVVLPPKYQTAYVIDGQHRLYGYSNTKFVDSNSVPVIAFVNMKKEDQVQMFMDINENQKAVPKVLRDTLEADLLYESQNYSLVTKSIKKRIAMKLGEKSVLRGMIQTGENPGGTISPISIDTIYKALNKTKFFNVYDKNNVIKSSGYFDYGCKTTDDKEKTENTIYELIGWMMKSIKTELCEKWNNDSGLMITNNIIYAIICLLGDMIDLLYKNNQIVELHPDLAKVKKILDDYLTALKIVLNNFDSTLNQNIRGMRGEPGLKEAWQKIGSLIYKQDNNFNPEWMPKYIDQFCQDNKEEANLIMNLIKKSAIENIRHGLIGIDSTNWRLKLIKTEQLNKLSNMLNKTQKDYLDKGEKFDGDILDVVDFEDIRNIIHSYSNWTNFGKKMFGNTNKELFKEHEQNTDLSVVLDDLSKRLKKNYDLSKDDFDDLNAIKMKFIDENNETKEMLLNEE